MPATPTECRIAYDADTLLVVFRCSEPNLPFPALHHGVDWYSKLHLPPEQDAAFPDQVSLYLAPNPGEPLSYYQFAATLDGLKFGAQWRAHLEPTQADEPAVPGRTKRIEAFEATVTREATGWTVFFRVPWKTIGGKPSSGFGLLPMRTRWRNGEVSSPVAVDFAERPPPDLFIETRFSNNAAIPPADGCLCQLPSGTLRWQRPALLSYPALDERQRIWRLQQSLTQPTNKDNLADRVYLTQRWLDLLTLEGLNLRTARGSIVEEDLTPFVLRRSVNAALGRHQLPKACQLLDAYLGKLDKASRKWFADSSPGNLLPQQWIPLSEVRSLETNGAILVLHCLAGARTVDLRLSLPRTGGIRLYGKDEGYFKPDGLLPLRAAAITDAAPVGGSERSPAASRCFTTPEGRIVIEEKPFTISRYDAAGNAVTQIEPGGLAFRFSPEGKVLAVDFKHHLDKHEVLYGFGEKFDRFNENGNVLTLWGMDDWTGLTIGLRNQSYKPVPVFHSSTGYSVFVNSSYRLRADIGKTRPEEYRLTQPGPVFDYYFWVGAPERALQSYTSLTGKPLLPPRWAFEPWMGRTGRGWNNTPAHDPVAEEERVVERFAALDIPHSAIYSEGSGADSPALHAFMAARGIKVLSWFYSSIPKARQEALLPDQTPGELPLLDLADDPASAKDTGYVDFSNPNAKELCRRWWARRLNLGVAGSMVDFGDRVPEEARFYDGRSGAEMHNCYAYDYQRTYYEVFREERGSDFILFGRAAAPGTQQWVAQFPGDQAANFAGLQAALTGALNLSACGFSTWGSDLGGFLGWPEPAVYMRWTQFACFSPLMRSHGRTPREPWEYGEAALRNYKHYAWVRENLLDYIYAGAVDSHRTGIPLMRSLAVAYPHEPALAGIADEYLFGSQLLVAPVITESDVRTIAFPPGRWTSLWDGRVIIGPEQIQTRVPSDTIPVYLKEGALVPVRLNSDLQFGGSMTMGGINALVVTPPKEKSEVSLLNTLHGPGGISLSPTPDGFALTLTNVPEMLHVLICGARVREVKADSEALPTLEATAFGSGLTGWSAEPATRRVVVRLSPVKGPRIPSVRIIEVQLSPAPHGQFTKTR